MKEKPAEQTAEQKLQALGAAPAEKPKADPLAGAKEAFEKALAKTKSQEEPEEAPPEEIVVEAVPRKKPKAEKAQPKPKDDDRIAELERRAAEAERRLVEATSKKPEPEPEEDPLEDARALLAEKFGQEEGEVLSGVLGDLMKPLLERTKSMEQLILNAQGKAREQAAKSNRNRIAKDHAHLKTNDKAWSMVTEQVKALIEREPTKYSSIDDVYDEVVEALYGGVKPAEKEAEEEGDGEAEEIAASSPTIPNQKTRERKLSSEEKSRAIFDHLFKNPDDAAGAKRLARQLKIN